MIRRDELTEVIKDILPEGEAGDKVIEKIMAIDVYPDNPEEPGPEYVKAEELDKAREEYSRRIREIFFGGKDPEGEGSAESEPKQELKLETEEEEDFPLENL